MNNLTKNEYYLKATLQKDYYKKAKVIIEGDLKILQSYNTRVIAIDTVNGNIIRLWNGWSVTTAKHINDFLMQHGFNAICKKDWLKMPCENSEAVYNMYYSTGFYTHKSNILLTEAEAEAEYQRITENNNRLIIWYE